MAKGGEATRMEEGEYYAIETFGSTGRGHVIEVHFDFCLSELRLMRLVTLLGYGVLALHERFRRPARAA